MLFTMSLKPHGMARISFEGGALLLPARQPYDCELVFQAATSYARRYGVVLLELQGHPITVTSSSEAEADPCAACARERGALTFHVAGRALCIDCARGLG